MVSVVDLGATFVFAVEGGLSAAQARLDLFGVAVVALVTATGGGMVRDVLIADTPPRALRNARYVSLGLLGGLVAFVLHDLITQDTEDLITVVDAVGLALFAVSGTLIALAAGTTRLTAVLLGTITAVGGGIARDLLLSEVPIVLQANIYALAAAVGAGVVVGLIALGRTRAEAMAGGAVACFVLRMVSVWLDWQLPVAG